MAKKANTTSTSVNSVAIRRRKKGIALYQHVWQQVAACFYDGSRLTDWKSWLHRFDKKIHSVEDALKYAKTMVGSLGDYYTRLLTAAELNHVTGTYDSEYVGIAATLRMYSGIYYLSEVTPGGPAYKAGLRSKDVFRAIDGKSVDGMDIVELRALIRGKVGSLVKLTVRRGEQTLEVTVVRASVKQNSVTSEVLPGNVGYVRLTDFEQDGVTDKVARALKRMQSCNGIVLDLRANEGGDHQNVVRIASLFLRKGKLMSLAGRIPDSEEKITKVISLTRTRLVSVMSDGDRTRSRRRRCLVDREMPVVVLVDRGSASSAEVLAAALQENGRALVVGTRTFGKGISQGWLPLAGGGILSLTMYTAHTPSGHWLGDAQKQRFGIKPDVVVRSRGRIYNSSFKRDKQLQAACSLIPKKKGK